MGTVLLVLVVVLVIAALVFGVVSMLSGDDPGLRPAEPDSRAVPLPNDRSLTEDDIKGIRFDVALRGYRMTQVDRALRRTAYDIGYKDEMIAVLEAEVAALREGRIEDADLLRKAREAAANPTTTDASAREDGSAPEDAQPAASEGETHAPQAAGDDVEAEAPAEDAPPEHAPPAHAPVDADQAAGDVADAAPVADALTEVAPVADAPAEEAAAADGTANEPYDRPAPATAEENAETPAEQARG